MQHSDKAKDLFLKGYNCAQSVFCAFCDVTGLDFDTAAKLSSSFGGGMGKLREVCGACTGAFMVVGMLYGYSDPENDTVKAKHYALIRRIADEFRMKHSTYICRELLDGIDTGKSINPQKRTEQYYKTRPCANFVADAAEIVDRIISENSK